MTDQELQAQAVEQGIDVTALEHEAREVKLIVRIAGDPVLALHLAFKGGTALRLVYLSDRYSNDLDFDLVGDDAPTADAVFQRLMRLVERERFEVVDAKVKRSTILLSVRERGWKRQLKIEVSRLPRPGGAPTVVRNVVTSVYPVPTNVLTYPMPVLLSGKMLAVLERRRATPRDLYDLWWLLSRKIEEDRPYLVAASTADYGDRRALYRFLVERVDRYGDRQIATELCAMLPKNRRSWVREELKERTKELLMLRMAEMGE